jgi:uroporphyrinogen-III synthase
MPGSGEAPMPGPPRDAPILLLTRARAQADRFAAEAAALPGPLRVVVAPLIEIVPQPLTVDPAGFATLIFTSENGVAAFCAQSALRDRPAFCVGPRTAAAAAAAGFAVRSAEGEGGDAAALMRLLRTEAAREPLLHLRGAYAAADIAAALGREGLACAEAVVYAQGDLPLSAQGRAALEGSAPVLLPLFSPRSARLAGEAVAAMAGGATGRGSARLLPVAISRAAAEAWRAAGGTPAARIAASPDASAMLAALAEEVRRLSA